MLTINVRSCLFSVDCYSASVSQSKVVCLLRFVRRLHLRRSAHHERAAEAEPAKGAHAMVSHSGHLQVRMMETPSGWRISRCLNGLECCTHVSLLCSIVGAMRTGFYMLHMIRTAGFRDSVCDTLFYNAPVTKLWAYVFTLSKAPELGEATAIPHVLVIS